VGVAFEAGGFSYEVGCTMICKVLTGASFEVGGFSDEVGCGMTRVDIGGIMVAESEHCAGGRQSFFDFQTGF